MHLQAVVHVRMGFKERTNGGGGGEMTLPQLVI